MGLHIEPFSLSYTRAMSDSSLDTVKKHKVGSMFKDQEGTDVDILQEKLQSLPPSMVIFSSSLRKLYATAKVTDQDKETRNFLAVRDSVRQNGIVDINKAIGVCDILKQYHNSIIKDLMRNQDKAEVSVTELTKMKERYRVQEQELMDQAKAHKIEAAKERDYSVWGAIFSFGISAAVSNNRADEADAKAKHEHLEAIGKKENADIAFEAVSLVKGYLIPAVSNFIGGLEVCATFLSDTKERLMKMKQAGDKGPRKPF